MGTGISIGSSLRRPEGCLESPALLITPGVTNDGVLLAPVNDAIPVRKIWDLLACPLCGTALVHEGQLHTAERGWW